MNTSDANLSFPVLGLSPDNDVWGFPDLRSLTTCGPRTLSNKMQDRLELVDADGRRWRVISVRSTGRAGPVMTRWITALLTGAPQFRVEHELEALQPLSLQQVQARVCEAIEAHPDFWCEDDERSTVLPERLAEVRGTSAIGDIQEVLGLDTFESY